MELKDRRFILLDTETTGYDSKKNQLLEVGMLCIDHGVVIGEINILIKHKEYTLTGNAMAANKIDIIEHEKVANTEEVAIDKMLEFFEEYKNDEHFILIGQNVDFDIRFLEELFLKHCKIKDLRQYVGHRKLDLMQLALIKNLEGSLNIEKQDLNTLLNALNIEIPDNRHRALVDCYLEYEVFKKLINLCL